MRITSEDIFALYRPSYCELRPQLNAKGIQPADPTPFELVIRKLGAEHERAHLATLAGYVDLSDGSLSERASRTIDAVARQNHPIYQGVLSSSLQIAGVHVELVGVPDFLIPTADGIVIRDAKIARHADEDRHPEILKQLCFYGWLYRECFGALPARLEVLLGSGLIAEVSTADIGNFHLEIEELVHLKNINDTRWEAVGWTKCGNCAFNDNCWPAAILRGDTGIVPDIDQSLSTALMNAGIKDIRSLVATHSVDSLSAFTRPWGLKQQKVGKRAQRILQQAKAIIQNVEIKLGAPSLPSRDRVVALDLEGMPPYLDEAEKVYLWGLKAFCGSASEHKVALAEFGADGEGCAWRKFLDDCKTLFTKHGDVSFLHWSHYEKTKIARYIKTFGDNHGIGERVLANLVDLLPITKDSIVLPIPSYSLKVVEKYIGFKRALPEANGQWSMAKYIEAVETTDEDLRRQVMNEIVAYNHEDLDATWAVFQWLESKQSSEYPTPPRLPSAM